MRKFLCTSIVILLTLGTYAQHGSLGAYLTGAQTYRTIDNNERLDNTDSEARALYGGLSFRAPLHKRWNLLTGVEYSVSGYNRIASTFGSYIFELRQRLRYLGLPASLEYKITSRKAYASFYGGVIHKLLISGKLEPHNYNELPFYIQPQYPPPQTETLSYKELKRQGFHLYNLDLSGGVQIGYSIRSVVIGLAPEFRYALIKTAKKGTITYHTDDEYLHSMGIKLFVTGK